MLSVVAIVLSHSSSGTTVEPGVGEVEAVGVHHLGPGGDEVGDELCSSPWSPANRNRRIDLGERPELGVGAEGEVGAGRRPLLLVGPAAGADEDLVAASSTSFHAVPMSSRLTKKSLVSWPGRSVSTPCFEPP
jgi:hypothetical protein